MNTKRILFSLIITTAIILTLQSHKREKKEFKRNFESSIKIKENDRIYREENKRYLTYTASDKNVIFVKEKNNKDAGSNFNLVFLEPSTLKKVKNISINLPDNSQILYATSNKIYYRNKLEVYEYDLESDCSALLTNENIKIFRLYPLLNNKVLCLGNIFDKELEKNVFSFFTLNLVSSEVEKIEKELLSNLRDKSLENSLKFTGKFISTDNKIAYVFDKYGKIEIFDQTGEFLKEISTVDRVPIPKITFFNDIYTYKRGSTFYSNSGALIDKNQVLVFSCRPNDLNYIVVDTYDIDKGLYKSSYKLNYAHKKSNDINFIFHNTPNNFIIGFENFYQSFDLQL